MKKIGFIGMGNMARAIVRGVLAAGAAEASDLSAYALHFDRLSAFAAETGIAPCRTLDELLERSDTVVVAVKPYVVEQVLKQAGDRLRGKALLSVAAGWPLERYRPLLDESVRVQTLMPNTPCSVGEGMLLFEEANTLTAEEHEAALKLFHALGEVEILPADKMSAGMAIAGCGPAYAYLFMEALADGAVKCGVPRAKAVRYAAQMLLGSASLTLESGHHPGALKDAVCSPGGSTIAGVAALEDRGFRGAAIAAVETAYRRTEELG